MKQAQTKGVSSNFLMNLSDIILHDFKGLHKFNKLSNFSTSQHCCMENDLSVEYETLTQDETQIDLLDFFDVQSTTIKQKTQYPKLNSITSLTNPPEETLEDNSSNSSLKKEKRKLPQWMDSEFDSKKTKEEKSNTISEKKGRLKDEAQIVLPPLTGSPNMIIDLFHKGGIFEEVKTPPSGSRIICFDVETTGFASTDR